MSTTITSTTRPFILLNTTSTAAGMSSRRGRLVRVVTKRSRADGFSLNRSWKERKGN
jgi:hypothetical protein